MKKSFHVLFLLMLIHVSRAQDTLLTSQPGDIFMDYVRKMYFTDRMSFDAEIRKKNLFETDTILSKGWVYLAKMEDSITYIVAQDMQTSEKMLFERDTLWYLEPQAEAWQFLNTGIQSVKSSKFGIFIPLDFLTIAYAEGKYVPYWKVREVKGDLETVELYIGNTPPEISQLGIQIEISRKDTLAYRFTTRAVIEAYDDDIFQETALSNIDITSIQSLSIFGKARDLPREINAAADAGSPGKDEEEDMDPATTIPLNDLRFENLDGSAYSIPQYGLAFLDFWYAGCFPCMKAAPVIEKMYHTYGDKMTFLSVNELDKDKEKISRFQQKMELTCPVLLNRGSQLASLISGANAYPLFVIMDLQTGECLWFLSGYRDNLEEVLEDAILESLK